MPYAKDPERFEKVYQAIKAGCTTGREVSDKTGYNCRQVAGAIRKLRDTARIEHDGWTSDPIKGRRYKLRTWAVADASTQSQPESMINRFLRGAL